MSLQVKKNILRNGMCLKMTGQAVYGLRVFSVTPAVGSLQRFIGNGDHRISSCQNGSGPKRFRITGGACQGQRVTENLLSLINGIQALDAAIGMVKSV